MKKNILLIILFLIIVSINAYDFNIDVEAGFFYNNYIKNEAYQFMALQVTPYAFDSYQKLRIKLKESIDQIKLNFDARFYIKPNQSKFDYYIDSAYFSFENGPFVLYAGKQRIKWGVGYTWNPADYLQPSKNILDPLKDLEGFYAIRMEYSNDFITPSLIISPDPESADVEFRENFRFALQLYKLLGKVDLYINSIYQMNHIQTTGFAISYDVDFLVLNLEGAAVRNMQISPVYPAMNDSETISWTYLIGFTKTIESKFFIAAEYYYNGRGFTNYEFIDYVGLYSIASLCMKKRYTSINLSWTWDDKWTFAIAGIYGLDDSMFLFYPRVEYIENSNFNFEIGLIENIADKNKETYYSMPVYNILSLKLKAYF